MTASPHKLSRTDDQVDVPQFGLRTIGLMFAWPMVWMTLLIYGSRQLLIPEGQMAPTWFLLLAIILGNGAELATGLVLLRREGYRLSVDALRDRLRFRWPRGWRAWSLAVITLIVGMSLNIAMGPINGKLASMPGFIPPSWWPTSNPNIETRSAADFFPDIDLAGNYLFVLLYFVIDLMFNIFGEETYYRGYVLPRMRGVFGRWDWVANGVLFTLKHIYQRWLYPGILVGGLCFAFAAGPLGSLPLAMVYHWVGNFLFQMIFLIRAAMGVG